MWVIVLCTFQIAWIKEAMLKYEFKYIQLLWAEKLGPNSFSPLSRKEPEGNKKVKKTLVTWVTHQGGC